MTKQNDIQQVQEWLNRYIGTTLIIEKQELDDTDTVHFTLSGIDERSHDHEIDDYLESALLLRGQGNTQNNDGESVPIPGDTYEIITHDLRIDLIDDTTVHLNTERATYKLSAK